VSECAVRLSLLAFVILVGCGGTDGGQPDAAGDPPIDADVVSDAGTPGDAGDPPLITGGEYGSPAAFDRLGCEAGSLADLDPVAIWHLDERTIVGGVAYDGPRVMRVLRGFAGLTGRIGAQATVDIRLTSDDLFLRTVTTTTAGELRIAAIDACKLEDDGSLTGHSVDCGTDFPRFYGVNCLESTFRAVRVDRRAGEAEASGLTLLGSWNGDPTVPWQRATTTNVRVKDGLAYLSRLGEGLRIIDVSDPAAMFDVGSFFVRGSGNDVKLVERASDGHLFALISATGRPVTVIDVSDPAKPVYAAQFPVTGALSVHTIFTETREGMTRAYIASDREGGIQIWDVTDPALPVQLGSYIHPDIDLEGGFVHDLYVEDSIAYLAYWQQGLVAVDTNDAANITLVGQFQGYERRTTHSTWVTTVGGCKVALIGDEDIGAHLRLVGVDPACSATFFQQIGELSLRPEVSIHNIMAFGETGYIAWYQDGLRLVDLSTPATPTVSAYFNTWDATLTTNGTSFYEGAIGLDVDLVAGRLYVADIQRGLLVFGMAD
jgi:hypothetical protein